MNEAIKTQISAFVDGELPDSEADLLLRRMSQDPQLRREAADYLEIGRIMRGESSARGIERLRQRIAAAIDDKVFEEGEGVFSRGSQKITEFTDCHFRFGFKKILQTVHHDLVCIRRDINGVIDPYQAFFCGHYF